MTRRKNPEKHTAGTQDRKPARAKDKRDMLAAQRERLAVEMRMQGYEFAEIAASCGYFLSDGSPNASSAYKAWKRALQRIPEPVADEARKNMRMAYNIGRRGLWDNYKAGKTWAVEAWLAIDERESKLFGLDQAPPKDPSHDPANAIVYIRAYPPEWVALTQQQSLLTMSEGSAS